MVFSGPKGTWTSFHRGCLRDNIDAWGGDIKSFISKGIDKCKAACAKNKKCVAFTMDKKSTRCWIKHAGHRRPKFNGRVMTGFMTCYNGGGPSPTLGGGNFELLSHKKKTKQSSTGWGGVPSRAVDGNPDGVYGRKSVSHSRKGKNNWWLVDLGEKKHINLVLVYNRADRCCANRISGTKVCIICLEM